MIQFTTISVAPSLILEHTLLVKVTRLVRSIRRLYIIFLFYRVRFVVLIELKQYTTCILDLNRLLDVEHPWVMIVKDPSGLSEFTSNDDVLLLDA